MDRRWMLLGVLALAWFVQPSGVRAKCRNPALEVLWSYPADGAVDVPTNAQFWALTPYAWAAPAVTLDGLPLVVERDAEARGTVFGSLGALEAHRDYSLRLDYSALRAQEDAGGPRVIEVRFRTGAGPSAAPAAPSVLEVSHSEDLVSACSEVVRAQECIDTGPNRFVSFEVQETPELGWLVDGRAWPVRCGPPFALVRGPGFPVEVCFELRSIGAGGLVSSPRSACATSLRERSPDAGAESEDQMAERAAGCSLAARVRARSRAWSSITPLIALAMLLGARGRRRRT